IMAILMVANILIYNYAPASFDWTESTIYTLSDQSRNVLKALDQPAKAYIIMPDSDLAYRSVKMLMDNAASVTNRLTVEYLSPDLDPQKLRNLYSKYQFNERTGILVVYGPEGKEQHQSIKYDDIFARDPDSPAQKNQFL